MRKLLLLVLTTFMLVTCSGCFYDADFVDEGFEYGYNSLTKKAFVGPYYWNGDMETQNVVVQDEYNGYIVSKIGGYHGRGYPRPFWVEFPDDYDSVDSSVRHDLEDGILSYELIVFNITIGKNISEIVNVELGEYHQKEEDGIIKYYQAVLYFVVDEDNDFLYSKEGKLYYVENDILVDEFIYYEE